MSYRRHTIVRLEKRPIRLKVSARLFLLALQRISGTLVCDRFRFKWKHLPAVFTIISDPLAHTFIRLNRYFSVVINLATSLLLIICQKEKILVIFRKNRHALRTCGSATHSASFHNLLSTELRFVFQEIQVVFVKYVALIVHDIVLVLYIILVPW